MNLQELDLQYSPSKWSKRFSAEEVIDQHIAAATSASNDAKATIPSELGVPYGTKEGEKLDIFGGESLPKEAPILVYVHGGYWQSLERSISSYCVKPFYEVGIRVIVAGYDLAPTGSKSSQSIISLALKYSQVPLEVIGGSKSNSTPEDPDCYKRETQPQNTTFQAIHYEIAVYCTKF